MFCMYAQQPRLGGDKKGAKCPQWEEEGLAGRWPTSSAPSVRHTMHTPHQPLCNKDTYKGMCIFLIQTLCYSKPSRRKLLRNVCIYLSATLCIQLHLALHEHQPPPIHTKPIHAPPVMLQSLLSSPPCIYLCNTLATNTHPPQSRYNPCNVRTHLSHTIHIPLQYTITPAIYKPSIYIHL